MEEHCSYQKWITKDKPDFYIRESEGQKPTRVIRRRHKPLGRLRRVFNEPCEDAQNQQFLNQTLNELKSQVFKKRQLPSLHDSSTRSKANASTTTKQSKSIHQVNETSETAMLTLYLNKLHKQSHHKPQQQQIKSTSHQFSLYQSTNQSAASHQHRQSLYHRNATDSSSATFECTMQKEDTRRMLREVLECYQLMASFEFSNDETIKIIKDSLEGKNSIYSLFLKRYKVVNQEGLGVCEDRIHFVGDLNQLLEAIKNSYFSQQRSQHISMLFKEIREYKLTLEEKVIRRINQRITELERSIDSKGLTLLQATGSVETCFVPANTNHINLQIIEARYGEFKLSRAQREVFMRLSEYFERESHL